MQNATATISPTVPTDPASPINPVRESAPGILPEPSAATLAAGHQAVEQHAIANGGKKRGRPEIHGKYAGRKRNKPAGSVPLDKMASSPAPLLLEENLPVPVEIGTEAIEEPFTEEVNREYAAMILGLLVQFSNARKRAKIAKQTSNEELADFVISKKVISPGAKASIESAMLATAKKYNVNLSRTPEGMLIGGLLLWQTEDNANTKALIAEYFKMRPEEKPA